MMSDGRCQCGRCSITKKAFESTFDIPHADSCRRKTQMTQTYTHNMFYGAITFHSRMKILVVAFQGQSVGGTGRPETSPCSSGVCNALHPTAIGCCNWLQMHPDPKLDAKKASYIFHATINHDGEVKEIQIGCTRSQLAIRCVNVRNANWQSAAISTADPTAAIGKVNSFTSLSLLSHQSEKLTSDDLRCVTVCLTVLVQIT